MKTLSIILLLSFTLVWSATKAQPKHTNVILIMADDLGYECIGAYGNTDYKTPVIDKMADEGILFENAHAQPICTPSRVQIMTGKYNVRNYVKFAYLDPVESTFGHLFQNEKYKTCVVGKWQLGGGYEGPSHFGFDEYCLWRLIPDDNISRYPNPGIAINGKFISHKNGEYGPDVMSDYATQFIEENQDNPFFLYYPMLLVHNPFEATPESEKWNPKSIGKDNLPHGDDFSDVTYFPGMMNYMDKEVGKILNTLERLGLSENTLVIFTGDNGTTRAVESHVNGKTVNGGKGLTTDAGTHVPLIAHWPGTIPAKQRNKDIIDFSDILPTICEAANIHIPVEINAQLDGRSFLPQLKGKKGNARELTYSWYMKRTNRTDIRQFARTLRYKLYITGKFYDLDRDILEKNPLDVNKLDDEQNKIKKKLQQAIDYYSALRPKHLDRLKVVKKKK